MKTKYLNKSEAACLKQSWEQMELGLLGLPHLPKVPLFKPVKPIIQTERRMHGNEPNKIFVLVHNSASSSKRQAALRDSTGVYPLSS